MDATAKELLHTLAALDEIAGLMELIREQKKDSDILPKFEDYHAKTVKQIEEYAVEIEKLIEDSEESEVNVTEDFISETMLIWKALAGYKEAIEEIKSLEINSQLSQKYKDLSGESDYREGYFKFVRPYQHHTNFPGSSICVFSFVGCKSGEHLLNASDCNCQ